MKKQFFFGLLIIILVVTSLFTACKTSSTNTSTSTTTTKTTSVSTTSSTVTPANWWNKFGQPQYGGSLTITGSTPSSFDPTEFGGGELGYWETLFNRDWTAERSYFKFEMVPVEYHKSGLAESWELTDAKTVTVKLYEGIKWQNKAPLNGRELTAQDVEYSYDRVLGTGNGFTERSPFSMDSHVVKVTAIDKYTVKFTLSTDAALTIYDVFWKGPFCIFDIVAPELVQQNIMKDWHNAVGSGAWMLTDVVSGSSMTYARNPDYWQNDERYPKNQLPYMDEIKELVISDSSTVLAALRSGKIDIISETRGGPTWQQAKTLSETNPDIQQDWLAMGGQMLEMRVDTKPFTDIRVRKALQMALDLKTIAKTHYGGTVTGDPEGLVNPGYVGWTLPYSEWPADLQAEYTFNMDKAKQLLADAGYPDGFKTNVVTSSSDDQNLLLIIKAQFKDIGVDMDMNVFADENAMRSYVMAQKQDQMTSTANAGHTRQPYSIITQRTSTHKENYTICNDPKYDEMVNKALTATSMDEVKKLITEADIYALQQHWSVNLFSKHAPLLWQSWVKGFSGEQVQTVKYFYFARLWIDDSLKK